MNTEVKGNDNVTYLLKPMMSTTSATDHYKKFKKIKIKKKSTH